MQNRKRDTDVQTDFWTLWEKARVECFERTACVLSIVKQITSPGGMHETSARAWCTGKTRRDWVEFHSFLRLRSIPLCVHITSSLFIRLLMDTLCASIL